MQSVTEFMHVIIVDQEMTLQRIYSELPDMPNKSLTRIRPFLELVHDWIEYDHKHLINLMQETLDRLAERAKAFSEYASSFERLLMGNTIICSVCNVL